jgi:signal transduction histidine kinase
MRVGRHKRQVFLFVAALLLPAAVLTGLAVRFIGQEDELAGKRADDERRNAIQQLRRELAANLEAIKLKEINGLIRSPELQWNEGPENAAVVFIAKLDTDRLVLPWEGMAQPRLATSVEFARHRREGEVQEFIKKDFRSAAEAYQQALGSARHPAERAEARLDLARILAKTGNGEAAARNYRTLLKEGGAERDEQGVAFRLYAAESLFEAKREQQSIQSFLVEMVKQERRLTLPEIYMIHSLLGSISGDEARQSQKRISSRIGQMEEAAALAKDLPRVRAQLESGVSSETVWIPYGKEPWLITITPSAPPVPALVLAVSSVKTAPPGVKLGGKGFEGELLGEGFPGVRVQWSANRYSEGRRRGAPFALYVAGLALVLGVTVLGGYLLLRDVNRDVRMAEVRSQFVASVSHELKTPLTAIRMFAETLALGRSKDERMRAEYLDTIVNESERLARLVDNVLDFSKIEQGKKLYRLRPTSLAGVADSAVRAVQYPLSQQGFTLRLSVEEDLPSVRADPDALQQAILNLLTNAMKYSGEAREIDLRLGSRNGDAMIAVTDRGLGIAADEQKHVFEKYYRAPSHESHLIAGTGLGLTLVAHIVEAHRGRVELKSAPGAGSTFTILIPVECSV